MITISIATQLSLYDVFGENGCMIFWLSNVIHAQLYVIGGFGIAVFRIICIENRLKQFNREQLVKTIHFIGFVIVISITTIIIYGLINSGWKQNGMYQFCKDYGTVKVDVFHSYTYNTSQNHLGKFVASINYKGWIIRKLFRLHVLYVYMFYGLEQNFIS